MDLGFEIWERWKERVIVVVFNSNKMSTIFFSVFVLEVSEKIFLKLIQSTLFFFFFFKFLVNCCKVIF